MLFCGSLPDFHHCFIYKSMSAKMLTIELSLTTKVASYTVLVCPKCTPKLKVASAWQQHNIYSWAITLSYGEHSTSWMVCHQCPLVHTHFILMRQVHCHHHRCHALPVVTQQCSAVMMLQHPPRKGNIFD